MEARSGPVNTPAGDLTDQLKPLSLCTFLHGAEDARSAFANSLLVSLRDHGIARLELRDVPGCDISSLFETTRHFFCLDDESKMVAAHPEQASPHRGYSYVGQENVSSILASPGEVLADEKTLVPDMKESFDMGCPADTTFPNQWPRADDAPRFRPVLEGQYAALAQAHLHVLRALAAALGLAPDHLARLHARGHHELRLTHYPPARAADLRAGRRARIAEHTDFGSLTLLLQDGTGGLEVRWPAGPRAPFRAVAPPAAGGGPGDDECLVMVGDSLQRWTGDLLRAPRHRVTAPPGRGRPGRDDEEWVPERFSVAFFGKPDRDVGVGNLAPAQFQQVQYDPITAGEYNKMKMMRTY